MKIAQKNEELKFIIGRYDHYYESVNNKGNLYLALDTFILGGATTGFLSLSDQYHFSTAVVLLFITFLITGLICTCLILWATLPYLTSTKSNGSDSLIFFRDVANSSPGKSREKWENLTEEIWYQDLQLQHLVLSKGLTKKFQRLNCATWLLGIQLILIVTFGIIFLNQ